MNLEHNRHDHWHTLFLRERDRLLATLGRVTGGGVIENLQHAGATSVPGVPAVPTVDILVAVVPFPLGAGYIEALDRLGYCPLPREETAPAQRFRHRSEPIQAIFMEAGSDAFSDAVILRDFLRQDEGACRRYAAEKMTWATAGHYEAAKAAQIPHWRTQAQAWWIRHYGFGPVRQIADELSTFPHPWYISSGWAIDLFLGEVTRVHHDVDVIVPHLRQMEMQTYLVERGWELVTPLEGRLEVWPRHMRLELPRHQFHAHRQGAFIDFLLTDIKDGIWRYRRDPTIVQSVERMAMDDGQGLSFLAPELVLLFKSKTIGGRPRPRDQRDFERVLPHLSTERRLWLRWALAVQASNHHWIEPLSRHSP